jgi:uncharacterized Zn finger protein
MSKPRRPYGNPPGRLPATMIKVLAAELSDQGRLARGKRYYADDAVIDIVVGHGSVTAEIQGSRARPYVVTIEAKPGSGVPAKRQLWIRCTCPDDTGMGDEACKHAVAAMFALSDEIAIDPDLLERWRGGSGAPHEERATDERAAVAEPAELPSNVVPIRRDRPVVPSEKSPPWERRAVARDEHADEIGVLLAAHAGALQPESLLDVEVSRLDHRGLRSTIIADVLDDALSNLRINWD